LGQKGYLGAAGFFLKINVTEIIVHKADQPNTLVDLFDAYSLTRERSAEIYFLFENADPSVVGNQSGAVVERIREFSDAPILPYGSLIDFGGHFISKASCGPEPDVQRPRTQARHGRKTKKIV
jgi:hypothetical protein